MSSGILKVLRAARRRADEWQATGLAFFAVE